MHSIVTLTMNPALDITTDTDTVHSTSKVRCGEARHDPGGGGVNVAQIAHVLGASVLAVFPIGGWTGQMLTELLAGNEVPVREVKIGNATRESFTVNETSTGLQYRFVLPGPRLTRDEQTRCLEEVRLAAASAQYVVASGSLPPGVPPAFYQRVADMCGELGVRFVLDTSGAGLQQIESGVYLLKPSLRELRECVDRPLATEAEQIDAARELIDDGRCEAIVVSLGADGALLVTARECFRYSAIPVRAVSGVGAGDAMVAAITVGLTRGWSLPESVRFGNATAAAMLLTPGTMPCTSADVERLHEVAPDPEPVTAAVRRSPASATPEPPPR
ncbi:1-phosphofructokinase family hexose kinase [Mycolicibacterium sp. XJ1819]